MDTKSGQSFLDKTIDDYWRSPVSLESKCKSGSKLSEVTGLLDEQLAKG